MVTMPEKWAESLCGINRYLGCWLDAILVLRDTLFIIIWSVIIIIIDVRTNKVKLPLRPSSPWYHDLRWIAALSLVVIHLADLGEILINNQSVEASLLELILPGCNVLTVLISCIYFDRIEVWRCKGYYLLWVCPYWLAQIVVDLIRWINFRETYTTQDGSSVAARTVLTWIKLVLSIVLLLCDLYVTFFQKRSRLNAGSTSSAEEIDAKSASNNINQSADSVFITEPSSSTSPNSCYLHDHSNLPNRATFFWLNPLLWAGFRTPLEQRDLGPLPENHKALQLGQKIRQLLIVPHKEAALTAGTVTTSLWSCYWAFSWPAILLGGFLKFTGDLVGYVAPLGIQVLVTYINYTSSSSTGHSDPASSESGSSGSFYYPSVEEFISNGYIMTAIVFLSSFLQGALSQSSSHVLCVEGIRLKTALQSFAYDKTLRLSSLNNSTESSTSDASSDTENHHKDAAEPSALSGQLDAGTFSQLLTEDCGNVMVLLCLGHYLWAIPLKLIVLLYLLHQKLGLGSVIAALLCLVIMVPAQFLLGSQISKTNKLSMKEADRRLAKIFEWLSNMKLFRLYAWERIGMQRIQTVRKRELGHLWSYSLQWAWATFLTQASTVALTLLSFILYPLFPLSGSASSSTPPAAQALSGLALIHQFTVPLTIIPVIVPDLIAACNSTLRLQEFFRLPEVDSQRRIHQPDTSVPEEPGKQQCNSPNHLRMLDKIAEDSAEEHSGGESLPDEDHQSPTVIINRRNSAMDGTLVRMKKATFSWQAESDGHKNSGFKLTGLDLEIRRGRLTVIVGAVGSGKSSLLMALLGELEQVSGSLSWASTAKGSVPGSSIHQRPHQLGYVAQKPWLMAASLRDNILFGSPLNPKRYDKVLESCALKTDLESWEGKDSTPIGSRGQNVSGGQKARIALARAIYSSASTVLLDDPFAALDPPVAQHVFHKAVQRILLRQGRSVVMATHQLEYAQSADHLIVMDSGRILVQGTPDDVASSWPELLHQRELDEKKRLEMEASSANRAKDRWNMIRLVTKTGNVFKSSVNSGSRNHEDGGNILTENGEAGHHQQRLNQQWRRRSSRLNALSIHMSHDLPLLTDEMVVEDDDMLPGRSRNRSFTSHHSRSMRNNRHLGSQNGPMIPEGSPQPRSVSFSIRAAAGSSYSSAVSFFLMRRRGRRSSSSGSSNRDRSSFHQQQQVSLNPLTGCDELENASGEFSIHPAGTEFATTPDANNRSSNKPQLFRIHSTPISAASKAELALPDSAGSIRKHSTCSAGSSGQRRSRPGLHRLVSNVSGFSDNGPLHDDCDSNSSGELDPERGLLVDPAAAEEERQYGRVPRRLYWLYARSCGLWLTLAYFVGSLGWQAARIATDYWLVVRQIESVGSVTEDSSSNESYLLIYCLLSVASVVTALLTNILGQAAGSQGRKRLHQDLLYSLSGCHTRLFDVEPTGRLLNRFNSDMAMIDKKLATTLQRLVQFVLMCLSAIVVNAFISRWSLLIAMVIIFVFYVLQRFFRTSARELQRLESLSKGPVVSHLTETLSGLSTLRAFRQERPFLATMHEHIDAHTATVLVLNSTNRWLGFALDSLGAAAVLVAMLLSLLVRRQQMLDPAAPGTPEFVTAGQVGLAVNYTLMTPIYLQWVVRFWSELEMYFNAVERVLHYSNLRQEGAPSSSLVALNSIRIQPENSWPEHGKLDIGHLYVTYHPNQHPPVIRDLNLSIKHGEKVGICGRTGSGKSTLVNSLFRLADAVSGTIKLDGVDLCGLEPHYLRSKLAVVPQDTLIIAGTLRDNLDPENKVSDEELYSVLEAVHLKETLQATGLDGELWKSGSCSLSVGQQQLLSLARAALRPSPVLILDEPSSALDTEAEQTLHHCLDHLFSSRTIILISHRVSSLRRCDRLCLMEDGRLVMEGTPDHVLSQLPIED